MFELLAKNAAGKLPLPEGSLSRQIEAFGFRVLPLTAVHVMAGASKRDRTTSGVHLRRHFLTGGKSVHAPSKASAARPMLSPSVGCG